MLRLVRISIMLIFVNIIFFSNINAGEIEVSGYATLFAGYTNVSDDVYGDFLADNNVDFTDKSHAGLQFNTEIYKNLDFSLTILMEGVNEFAANADWFYATYTVSNTGSFRFGRLKVPFFMVSNYIDIGHAYPWVSPPLEVYNVKLVKSVDGLEYVYQTDIFNSIFSLDMYIGSGKNHQALSPSYLNDNTVNTKTPPYKIGDRIKFKSHNLIGFESSLAGDNVTFRIAHYETNIDAEDFNVTRAKMAFSSAGMIINAKNFILYSEYVNRQSEDSIQYLFSDQISSYITVGYEFHKFLPYFTLANINKGKNKNKYGLMQNSTSFGIRYDVNPKMAVKFQSTRVTPKSETGDVGRLGFFDTPISDGRKPMVYSMSIDILF